MSPRTVRLIEGAFVAVVVAAAVFLWMRDDGPQIAEAVMSRAADKLTNAPLDPCDSFRPGDKVLHCCVRVAGAPEGTRVHGCWVAARVPGVMEDTLLGRVDLAVSGDAWLDYTTSMEKTALPPGEYRVDLYLEDPSKPARSVEFRVEGK